MPNFLEAQTRASVARLKADLRSVATALESYAVDHTKYVINSQKGTTVEYAPSWSSHVFGGFFRMLSTPVAYITNPYIEDPFKPNKMAERYSSQITARYIRYQGYNESGTTQFWDAQPYNDLVRGDPWGANTLNNPKVTKWIMWSYGPNRMKDLLDISERPNGADWDDYYIVNDYPERIIEFVYDPTNGTKSAGEIFRSGGGSSGVHPEYFSVLQQATSN